MESEIPDDIIKSIEEDVHKLILSLTPYEPNNEDFKRCVDFTMYNILCEKHLVSSETSTRESLDQFITRYDYEGFTKIAETFKTSLQTYLESYTNASKNKNNNAKWYVLDCLIQLSNDAFKTDVLKKLDEKLSICDAINLSGEFPEEEKIDWYAYLQEGSEKYRLPSDESDEDSSYDSDTPVETVIGKPIEKNVPSVEPRYNNLFDQFPQESADVPDPNTNLRKAFEDEFEAQEWLLNNVQNSWWRGEPHEIDVDFRDPTALFGLRWEEKFPINDLQFLEEYKFMRELLWVFVTNDESVRSKRVEYLRKKASISSLIQSTTSSIIEEILDSATRYFQLRAFYEEVFVNDNVLKIPFSYQAYAAVLKELCNSVLQKLLGEEDIIKEQEKTYTLLTLHNNLQPYLNDVNLFHEIHEDCVLTIWREEESWLCIVRLLSSVFFNLRNTESVRKKKILLRIFFRTFKVYADIIDEWLTGNKLYDWRNEFFIQKDEHNNAYVKFPLDEEEAPIAPFFARISQSLLNCGQNVEFLCKLNKMQSVASEILKDGTLIDSIIDEFLQHLHQRARTSVDILTTNPEYEMGDNVDLIFENGEMQEELTHNLYLIQAYSDVLQHDHFVKMVLRGDRSSNRHTNLDKNHWERSLTNLDLFPITNTLEKIICTSIEKKEAVIAKFFKLAIVDNYKFFDHIRTLTGLLLIDMRSFCSQMNARMNKKTWSGNHSIQILLYNCVQSNKLPFGELLHFVVDSNNVINPDRQATVCLSEVIKLIDSITLQYSTQWPMSKIFTSDVIKCVYDPLFKIVLKINLAMFNVTRLQFKDLPDTKSWRCKLRKVHVFRHWVILLLQKLRSYMMLIVPQCLGDKLIENVVEINNFVNLRENYLAYLEKVKHKCLIELDMMEYLNRALQRVWRVCDDVRELWIKAMQHQLQEQDVARAIELYVQGSWYLSQVLKKFVREKCADNPLYNLWSELHHMVKTHELNVPEDLSFKSNQKT